MVTDSENQNGGWVVIANFSLSESSPCQHLDAKVTDESLQLCSMGCTRISKVKDHSQCLFHSYKPQVVSRNQFKEMKTKVDLNSNPAYFFLNIDPQLKQVVVPQCYEKLYIYIYIYLFRQSTWYTL